MNSTLNRPLILVSNDDGYDAKGLRYLIDILVNFGDVVAVAPDGPRSGQSSAITVEQPLWLKRRADFAGAKIYSVSGTPVDCVKLAMHAVVDRKPDLLVAGINHGSNSGNSVIYSGTMGAVMEGCMIGIPSIGFSLLHHSLEADFSETNATVERVTKYVLANGLPNGICLNVNIPALCRPQGIKVTRAARGYWTEEYADYTTPSGKPFYWLTGKFHNDEPYNAATDEYWLKRQWSTVVPVKVDQSANDVIPLLSEKLNIDAN